MSVFHRFSALILTSIKNGRRLVEVSLLPKSLQNYLIDQRLRRQNVVVQVFERRVHSVDSSLRLVEVSERVREGVEAHGVRRRAVPSLSARPILHQVDPPISVRNVLVLVPIPLGEGEGRSLCAG